MVDKRFCFVLNPVSCLLYIWPKCDASTAALCALLHCILIMQRVLRPTRFERGRWSCRRKKEEQKRKKDQAKILGKRGARTKLSFKLG